MVGVAAAIRSEDEGTGEQQSRFGRLTAIAWASLSIAAIQAVCATFIILNGFSLALGTGTIVFAQWATYLDHNDYIRIPMLALATLGAAGNLLVVVNGWWLRGAPGAQWRKRSLSRVERRRILLTVGAAVITLVIVAIEMVDHKILLGHF